MPRREREGRELAASGAAGGRRRRVAAAEAGAAASWGRLSAGAPASTQPDGAAQAQHQHPGRAGGIDSCGTCARQQHRRRLLHPILERGGDVRAVVGHLGREGAVGAGDHRDGRRALGGVVDHAVLGEAARGQLVAVAWS